MKVHIPVSRRMSSLEYSFFNGPVLPLVRNHRLGCPGSQEIQEVLLCLKLNTCYIMSFICPVPPDMDFFRFVERPLRISMD